MWNCPRCSESNEDSFDSCWKCGTGKDGTPPPAGFIERAQTHEETGVTGGDPPGEDGSSGLAKAAGGGVVIVAVLIGYLIVSHLNATEIAALGGGAIAGALCGLLPFFLLRPRSSRFAQAAIWICAGCGMVLGVVLALPAAILLTGLGFMVLPKKTAKVPPPLPSQPPPAPPLPPS